MRRLTSSSAVIVLFATVLACTHSSWRDSQSRPLSSPEQTVLASEQEWVNVALAQDADKFASFLADEYVELAPGARTVDKATWVSAIRSGKTKYESVELSNLIVRVYGDTAVVLGDFTQKATSGGKDNSAAGKYVNTWINRDGRWQLVASGFSTTPTSALH